MSGWHLFQSLVLLPAFGITCTTLKSEFLLPDLSLLCFKSACACLSCQPSIAHWWANVHLLQLLRILSIFSSSCRLCTLLKWTINSPPDDGFFPDQNDYCIYPSKWFGLITHKTFPLWNSVTQYHSPSFTQISQGKEKEGDLWCHVLIVLIFEVWPTLAFFCDTSLIIFCMVDCIFAIVYRVKFELNLHTSPCHAICF